MASEAPPSSSDLPHRLKFPTFTKKPGPPSHETREVAILTELQNLVAYSYLAPGQEKIAGRILGRILLYENAGAIPEAQRLWTMMMSIFQTMPARKGERANQAVNVMIAREQIAARAESLSRLESMGPRPQEPQGRA